MFDDKATCPDAIRTLRHALNLTQEGLAHTIGVTVSTCNRWERGHSVPQKIARQLLERLAAKSGVRFGTGD